MKKAILLSLFREAGYHGNKSTFTRLLLGNKISLSVANEHYAIGVKQKRAGMKCLCNSCNLRLENK